MGIQGSQLHGSKWLLSPSGWKAMSSSGCFRMFQVSHNASPNTLGVWTLLTSSLNLFRTTQRHQEFLKWIFAEDKEISKGLQGKYMLSIAGHDQFNWEWAGCRCHCILERLGTSWTSDWFRLVPAGCHWSWDHSLWRLEENMHRLPFASHGFWSRLGLSTHCNQGV